MNFKKATDTLFELKIMPSLRKPLVCLFRLSGKHG